MHGFMLSQGEHQGDAESKVESVRPVQVTEAVNSEGGGKKIIHSVSKTCGHQSGPLCRPH